ncbi:Putative ribonuclease H protein At1g65750 [Linum perenne]
MGIPITRCLGRYLGIPLLHGRSTNAHYKYILENLDSRLSGWKSDSLSLAGRVTLASSVLNAIPSFAMQTSMLPNHICEQIDKRIRSFVWGSTQGQRKCHLVNWENICKPKEMGGLGLRSAKSLNQAFILKIAWGILKRPNELWADVLLTKYMKRTPQGLIPRGTKRFSNLWRGVKEVWHYLNLGLQWSIGDGLATSFWHDTWLDSGQRLANSALNQGNINAADKVADFCSASGGWDIDKLQSVISTEAMQQVLGMIPPSADLGADKPVWGLEGNGGYSVKSGYLLINELNTNVQEDNSLWKCIWKWPGPNKIRHFMWLVSHNRILTNQERKRRHMTDDDSCVRCGAGVESIDHCLRLCHVALQVWQQLVPASKRNSFFSGELNVWWANNVRDKNWVDDFAISCWLIWKNRNEWAFQDSRPSADDILAQLNYWKMAILKAKSEMDSVRCTSPNMKEWRHIAWEPAPDPWCTLNSDGSVNQNGAAAAGGVLRNYEGEILSAYTMNLGSCSITRAEIRGIVEGMNLAWERGVRHLAIQTDSRCAVQILSNQNNVDHQHAGLVKLFTKLLERDWIVSLSHVYRESNFLADSLALTLLRLVTRQWHHGMPTIA